jgi:hypothetical protein
MKLAVLTGAVLAAVLALTSVGASAQPLARSASAGKGYSAKVRYTSTSNGHQQGNAITGVDGHGSFSAHLGSSARIVAAVLSAATGVPYTKIAKGGTYKAVSNLAGSGGNGVVVAKFKAGLGSACLKWTDKAGAYKISLGYVPVSGKIRVVGGTGAAAHWRGSATFKQSGINGSSLEQILFAGALKGSTGRARRLSAACKKVAREHT